MTRLLLLFLVAAAAPGQISNLTCEATDRQAFFTWTLASPSTDSTKIAFANATTPLDRETNTLGTVSSTTARGKHMGGLAPSTRYYFDPSTTGESVPAPGNCPGTCTNCGPGDWTLFASSSGCDCDAGGNPPSIVTGVLDQRSPTLPTHNSATRPSSFTTDALQTCGGLQAAMDVIPDNGTDHRIRIAPGVCEISQALVPPNLTAGGTLVLEPDGLDANPRLLPPAVLPSGHVQQTDPRYAGNMVLFRPTTDLWWIGGTTMPRYWISGPAEGLFTRGIGWTMPDVDTLPHVQFDVASVNDSTDTITTTAPHGFRVFDWVYLNLPGWDMVTNPGAALSNAIAFQVGTIPSATEFMLLVGCPCDFSGYTSGGVVTLASPGGVQITSISGNIVETAQPHGLPNYPTAAITSITGTTLVTATDITQPTPSRSIAIKGTPASDGVYWVTAGSVSPYTLDRAPGDCSAGCGGGTAQRAPIINIGGTVNANLPYPFTVASPTQITLEGASGLSESGGYAVYHPATVGPLIHTDGAAGLKRTTFSQALYLSPGFPYMLRAVFSGAPTQFRDEGSWAQGVNMWVPINPMSKRYDAESNHSYFGTFARYAAWENGAGTGDGAITQAMIYDAAGIAYFIGDQGTTAPDYTFSRSTVWRDDRLIWSDLNNLSRFYPSAQAIESKGSERMDFSGNYYRGWAAGGFVANGWTVNLSLRQGTSGNYMRDVTFDNSIFDRDTGSGILLDAADSYVRPFERVSAQNIWFGSRFDKLLVDSPLIGGGGTDGGSFMMIATAIADLTIRNLTQYHQQSKGPFTLRILKARISGFTFEDSILAQSSTNSDQWMGFFADINPPFRVLPINAKAQGDGAWDSYVRAVPNPDPLSSFSGNVLHGAVRDPHIGDFDTKMAAAGGVTDAVITTHYAGLLTGNTNITGSSGNDREEAVYQTDSFTPEPAYAGKGADLQAIQDAMLRPGPISVSLTATSITLSYRAPTTSGCVADLSSASDPYFSQPAAVRQQDTGADQSRSVVFNGLTPGEQYGYRVHCGAVGPSGVAVPGN